MNKETNDSLWSGGSYVMMRLEDIVVIEDFSSLFPIKQDTLDCITDSILKNGYDKSQPVTVWEIEKQKYILVDGHTRRKASENALLKEIPATLMHFNSLEDAKHYAFRRQVERRNLSQKELFLAALNMIKKEKRDGSGRRAEQLSKELGVSSSTLVHAKTVAAKASEEDINAIKEGKATINKVYQKIKKEKPKNERKNISGIKKSKKQLTSKLINIEDVLQLLSEHNETNAINVILEKYQNLEA